MCVCVCEREREREREIERELQLDLSAEAVMRRVNCSSLDLLMPPVRTYCFQVPHRRTVAETSQVIHSELQGQSPMGNHLTPLDFSVPQIQTLVLAFPATRIWTQVKKYKYVHMKDKTNR